MFPLACCPVLVTDTSCPCIDVAGLGFQYLIPPVGGRGFSPGTSFQGREEALIHTVPQPLL